MKKRDYKEMLIAGVMGLMLILVGASASYILMSGTTHYISLPEEISAAKPGDFLNVRNVHDTSYIEFYRGFRGQDNPIKVVGSNILKKQESRMLLLSVPIFAVFLVVGLLLGKVIVVNPKLYPKIYHISHHKNLP